MESLETRLARLEKAERDQKKEQELTKTLKGIQKTFADVSEGFRLLEKAIREIPKPPKYPTHIKTDGTVEVTNPVTEVSVSNLPEPVEKMTIKNPVESVTIKNPVKEVKIKNLPKIPIISFKSIIRAIAELPDKIKQATQPVQIMNEQPVRVVLFDPKRRETYRASFAAAIGGGGATTLRSSNISSTSVSVGASSTAVIAASRDRLKVVLVNDSDETIYLGFNSAAILNQGIRLNARGGTVTEYENIGTITAICASGGKNLTVINHLK
ncbi:hypothetical protein LCGC14_0418160 [marine sediment metagenome]|uniref:Uncharacterized protein n=1 Tax=marine sediment metagenome TaxID=412755 RepID=A0A0F9SRW9_9ZZZZ